VDEDAFRIEHRSHCPIGDNDLGLELFSELSGPSLSGGIGYRHVEAFGNTTIQKLPLQLVVATGLPRLYRFGGKHRNPVSGRHAQRVGGALLIHADLHEAGTTVIREQNTGGSFAESFMKAIYFVSINVKNESSS